MQTEVEKNGNYGKVKEVVDKFIAEVLEKIASGAREAAKGATGEDKIGGALTTGQDAAPGDTASVNLLVKGIKEIVGVVLKAGEGSAGATKTNNEQQKTIGKLFSEEKSNGGTEQQAAASASIGAVSGADILRAIAGSREAANNYVGIGQAKNSAEIAAAKKESQDLGTDSAKKDAVIAGGIALRGMAKGGKLAAKTDVKNANAVNGAVSSAVGKVLLSSLIVAIRETVDGGLKNIKEELGKVKEEDSVEEVVNGAEVTASKK